MHHCASVRGCGPVSLAASESFNTANPVISIQFSVQSHQEVAEWYSSVHPPEICDVAGELMPRSCHIVQTVITSSKVWQNVHVSFLFVIPRWLWNKISSLLLCSLSKTVFNRVNITRSFLKSGLSYITFAGRYMRKWKGTAQTLHCITFCRGWVTDTWWTFYLLALKETIFRALCHCAAAKAEKGRFTPGMSQQSGDAYSSDQFPLSDWERSARRLRRRKRRRRWWREEVLLNQCLLLSSWANWEEKVTDRRRWLDSPAFVCN